MIDGVLALDRHLMRINCENKDWCSLFTTHGTYQINLWIFMAL